MKIVNLSELDPNWNWLAGAALRPTRPLRWVHTSSRSVELPGFVPRAATLRRVVAAWRAAGQLEAGDSLLVSHGPRMAMYGAEAARLRRGDTRHLAYSFNFTQLPRGLLQRSMARAFRRVDRFVCFSRMEQSLYSRHFDLDPARVDMIHWAARPPRLDASAPPRIAGDYVSALGSQGRDHATLLEAMRRLPAIRLALVADAASLAGLSIPPNVEVMTNIPLDEAMNVLLHGRFTIVPLSGSEVPCGHVTLVSAMHAGQATVVSNSTGVADYVEHEVTGVSVPPHDAAALAQAIERLWQEPQTARRLGEAGRAFAAAHCGEDAAVAYLQNYLAPVPGASPSPRGEPR